MNWGKIVDFIYNFLSVEITLKAAIQNKLSIREIYVVELRLCGSQ